MNMAQLVFSSKVINVPFSKIFPWKSCGLLLLVNALFGVAFFFVKRFVGLEVYIGEVWESVALGGVWGVIYFGVLLKHILRHWRGLNSASMDRL